MIHALVLILALAAFALLLLAMARHQQDWLRRKLPPATSKRLRAGGFALLALAFAVAGLGLGWVYGTLAWCGWMTLAGITAVAANTNRERIQRLCAAPGTRP